uniref:Uncharacterized protein n=1 Tax=Anguilla anguilla TaxID=7936 RepID=A0A0E9W7G1_ANGAN
MVRLDMLM